MHRALHLERENYAFIDTPKDRIPLSGAERRQNHDALFIWCS